MHTDTSTVEQDNAELAINMALRAMSVAIHLVHQAGYNDAIIMQLLTAKRDMIASRRAESA